MLGSRTDHLAMYGRSQPGAVVSKRSDRRLFMSPMTANRLHSVTPSNLLQLPPHAGPPGGAGQPGRVQSLILAAGAGVLHQRVVADAVRGDHRIRRRHPAVRLCPVHGRDERALAGARAAVGPRPDQQEEDLIGRKPHLWCGQRTAAVAA
jgi:hypothetical protein